MKLLIPKAGVSIDVELSIIESPHDKCGATIRCQCESEKAAKDLHENITKHKMYTIRDDSMMTMKELPRISKADLDKLIVEYTYDYVSVNPLTKQEAKKVMIDFVKFQKED
jgi:hypothetical protein